MIIIGLTVLFINTSLKRVNNLFLLLHFTLAVSNDIVYAKRILPVFTIRLSSLDISQKKCVLGPIPCGTVFEGRVSVIRCALRSAEAPGTVFSGDANLPWQSSVFPEFIR